MPPNMATKNSTNTSRAGELKNLANESFKAHKCSQAIDLYTQAIEVNKDNAVYWANRALAHTKLEEYGSAIQDATEAIEINPKYSKVIIDGVRHIWQWEDLRKLLRIFNNCFVFSYIENFSSFLMASTVFFNLKIYGCCSTWSVLLG